MHARRRSGSFPGGILAGPGHSAPSQSRHQSIVEAAEAHFDKNTIILCINVVILSILMVLLYVVATSAKSVSGI
ncbi:hypothetical protein M3Y99_00095900 [Aphelenchoides fujianensis]|nr:hypothetical protein M3Y99_01993100 [Aphelenchoides fujianensis]KAI6242322.1 hypothetical protein M3Y99_00247300 [Aphelenchoides fujianensis]KAI6243396.1 hypothetical protein M3Y99_00134300 [Aphelenchoides fujianensis]KAI6243402.1 hypothetical protein M3Y99_00095900 [Aphelenchoides fujianensis]